MALGVWQATIVDDAGNVQTSAQIEVRRESNGALAAIYSDRDGTTPLDNPFDADSDGFARFYVAGGAFKITATKGGFSRMWRHVSIGLLKEFDSLPAALVEYERTAAEIAAGVTPTNHAIPSHDIVCDIFVERYGFNAFDPTSDQTSALQAAYDVAVELGGGVIKLPAGCDFRANIVVEHSGIYFEGQGSLSGATKWRNFSADAPIRWSNAERSIVGGGLRNIQLINRDSSVYTTTNGLEIVSEPTGFNQNDFLDFRDLVISNFQDGIHIEGRTIWNNWTNIRPLGSLRDALHVKATDNWAMQKFTNCRFGSSDRHGFYLEHTFTTFLSTGIHFDCCNFELNHQNAVRITGVGGVAGMKFTACYGEDNAQEITAGSSSPRKVAIHVDSVYALGLTFEDCQWLGNQAGGDPDFYIYVDTSVTTNVHGSVDDCRFGEVGAGGGAVWWPAKCKFGFNYWIGDNVLDPAQDSLNLHVLGVPQLFTPGISFGGASVGVTYSTRPARYGLVGRMVTANGYIALSSKGSSTGAAMITGLPYPALPLNNMFVPVSLTATDLALASDKPIMGRVLPNTSTIALYQYSGNSLAPLTDADLGNSSAIAFSVSYFI